MIAQKVFVLFLAVTVVIGDEYPIRIPDKLTKCYSEPELNNRFNRMPSSLDNLITLIKKIEAHPAAQYWDVSTLTGTILKRFRYDGIVDIPNPGPDVLPVKRDEFEKDKHRLTWALIPGQESDFPEDALSESEKCAMHRMLSYSVNHTMRAEEYTPGSRSLGTDDDDFKVEDNSDHSELSKSEENETVDTHPGEEKTPDVNNEEDSNSYGSEDGGHHHEDHDNHHEEESEYSRRRRETFHAAGQHSLHPAEGGVVLTKWGTVAIASVLSGIAAGLRPETVQLRNLITDPAYAVSESSLNRTAESPWVVTLAADMAQTALLRASKTGALVVGPRGSWNSTTCPKEYYLENDDPSLMTTAEIYGGIDGLLIAHRISSWNTDYTKLSTILEAYYSEKGVYPEREYRACNRINLFRDKITPSMLKEQALNSAIIFYAKGSVDVPQPSPGTRPVDMIGGFVNKTYNLFSTYLNNKDELKQDFDECSGGFISSEPLPSSLVDLTVVVDQSSDETEIKRQKSFIASLVKSMNIGTNSSRLEIVSSKDATVLSGFELGANKAALSCSVSNLAISKSERRMSDVMAKLRSRIVSERSRDKQNRIGGYNGRVVLFIVSSFTANTAEKDKMKVEFAKIQKETPDVRLMFVTETNPDEFKEFVEEPNYDIMRLSNYANYQAAANSLAERLNKIPARIVYPACSALSEAASEIFYNFTRFLPMESIQYLQLDPYQFFASTAVTLKFQVNYGLATVCLSRSRRQPTTGDDCKTTSKAGETIDFKIVKLCGKVGIPEACQPIYVSVANKIDDSAPCQETNCQSAQDVKYVVSHEGMKCNSAAAKLISHLLLSFALVFCLLAKRKA